MLQPTFSCIDLCAMNDDNDTGDDDDYTGNNDAKLAFVPTDGSQCPCDQPFDLQWPLSHMITASNVLQYWPLCHDYSYYTITVVRMPSRPTIAKIGLHAIIHNDQWAMPS